MYLYLQCPCLMRQAIVDRGRYAPDFNCDKDGNTECFYHQGAQHCVVTGIPKYKETYLKYHNINLSDTLFLLLNF